MSDQQASGTEDRKKRLVGAQVNPELYAWLAAYARANGQSMASVLRKCLIDLARSKGEQV